MKIAVILFILTITTFFGCTGPKRLTDKDCAHSHICCNVNCYCCPYFEFREKHPLLFSSSEIASYIKTIDTLKNQNKLEKLSYPIMSACGGGLDGYYLNKKIVLIDATYKAELGFSSRKYYIDQEKFVEIIYREYFAEWEKYEQKYPSEKYEFDESKMTYTDTIYTISFTTPTILMTKQSNNKIISRETDEKLLERLVQCGEDMKRELNEVINENKSPNR